MTIKEIKNWLSNKNNKVNNVVYVSVKLSPLNIMCAKISFEEAFDILEGCVEDGVLDAHLDYDGDLVLGDTLV